MPTAAAASSSSSSSNAASRKSTGGSKTKPEPKPQSKPKPRPKTKTKPKTGPTAADLKRRGKSYSISGNNFYCPGRYQPKECLGQGAYGVVCRCIDRWTRSQVAIKKVAQVSRSTGTLKQILREVRLMRKMDSHPLTVSLLDLYQRESKDEVYLVMELMTTDLHQVIQSDQALTGLHIQHFTYQILKGIQFIHSCGVLHRDLKPGNLLVNTSCDLKIADFGLSRTSADAGMTELVVTRWYRAPELILNPNGGYGKSVDLWSIGCIFAELLGRKPLFPGKQFVHQLELIFGVLGTPAPEDVAFVTNPNARDFLDGLKPKAPVPFSKIFPHVSPEALDFVERLLKFREADRLTTEECLAHPFMAGAELNCPLPNVTVPEDMECLFENFRLSKSKLKKVIAKEVNLYKRKRAELVQATAAAAKAGQTTSGPEFSRDEPAASIATTEAVTSEASKIIESREADLVNESAREVVQTETTTAVKASSPVQHSDGMDGGTGAREAKAGSTMPKNTDVAPGSPRPDEAETRNSAALPDAASSASPLIGSHNNDADSAQNAAGSESAFVKVARDSAVETAAETDAAADCGATPEIVIEDEEEEVSSVPPPRQSGWMDENSASDVEVDKASRPPTASGLRQSGSAGSPPSSGVGQAENTTALDSAPGMPSLPSSSSSMKDQVVSSGSAPSSSSPTSASISSATSRLLSRHAQGSSIAATTKSMVERYRALVRKSRKVSRSLTGSSKGKPAQGAGKGGAAAVGASRPSARRSRRSGRSSAGAGMSRLDRLVRGLPVSQGDNDSNDTSALGRTSSGGHLLKMKRAEKVRGRQKSLRKSKTQGGSRAKVTAAYSPKWAKRDRILEV